MGLRGRTMADLEIRDIPPQLKEGILLAERGVLDKAQNLFESYLETHPDSALALSYAGMLRSAKDGALPKGIEMCQEAARRDPKEALCFLNLARVYLAAGDRFQCVRAIHKGLKLRTPYRDFLTISYSSIGRRRNPPLRFLGRNNPLNNLLGKLSLRLGLKG